MIVVATALVRLTWWSAGERQRPRERGRAEPSREIMGSLAQELKARGALESFKDFVAQRESRALERELAPHKLQVDMMGTMPTAMTSMITSMAQRPPQDDRLFARFESLARELPPAPGGLPSADPSAVGRPSGVSPESTALPRGGTSEMAR